MRKIMRKIMKQLLAFLALMNFIAVIKSSDDCNSPECTTFVDRIKKNINHQGNPCDDFYEYACGKGEQYNSVMSDHHMRTLSDILEAQIAEKLTEIFNDVSDTSSATETFRNKAKKMYKNCMDLEAIEKNGVEVILSQLKKTGGWPAMMGANAWTPTNSVDEVHAYYIKTLQLPLFYTIYVAPGTENSTVNYLNIDALFVPFQFNSPAYSRSSPEVEQNVYYIAEIIKILASESGDNPTTEDMENDIKNMMDFEATLFKIMPEMATREVVRRRRNLMTIHDFQEFYDNHSQSGNAKISWINFLRILLSDTEVEMSVNDVVMIPGIEYVADVAKLLDTTPIRTIINYMQWRFVEKMLSAAPENLRNIAFKMDQIVNFIDEEPQRDEVCRELVGLKYATDYEYVKRYFPQNAKQLANDVLSAVFNAPETILNASLWLMPNEQDFLHQKLSSIKRFVGYPDWFDEPSAIDNYYQQCEINDNFMENIIEVERFEMNISLSQLLKPVDPNRFPMDPSATSTLHTVDSHSIVFPAAMLQKPIFSAEYPGVLQYATFGNFAGRAISQKLHIYETANGEVEWRSNRTKDILQSKIKCFIEQYDQYKIYQTANETIYVDGTYSKNENIGDLLGLKFAYEAYKNLGTSKDEHQRLAGLESFTNAQLFFLAYANNWCSRSSYSKTIAKINRRPSAQLRLIGTLSNMEEFSSAFNCPVNTKMNPSNKCGI